MGLNLREYPVEKLDRADGECMEQPSCSECRFPQAENFGKEMEEEGKDVVGKTSGRT